MKEITRYQASWGAWYVQVLLDNGKRMELKFDHEPKFEEVEKVVLSMPIIKDIPQPVLVELTVDNAISFLNEKLVEAVPTDISKITAFVAEKAVKPVEPLPIDPIKVVK